MISVNKIKIKISPKIIQDRKTINSNNYAKFEVNWPRGSQFTVRHTKNRLQFDENSKFHHKVYRP